MFPGKTVLASVIVEEASKIQFASTVFFYCKHMDPERSSFISVARSILSQLLSQNEVLLPYLYDSASRSGESTLTTPQLAEELLETSLKSWNSVYVILDGLDECDRENRKNIVTAFRRIVESLPIENADQIRCLFVSQDDNAARKDFATISSFKMSAADNQRDIDSYVATCGNKIKEKFGLSEDKTRQLVKRVAEESEGMFPSLAHCSQ
jgi:hypothetical protein